MTGALLLAALLGPWILTWSCRGLTGGAWYTPLIAAAFPAAGCCFVASYVMAERSGSGVHEIFWLGVALVVTAVLVAVLRSEELPEEVGLCLAGAAAVVFTFPKVLRSHDYFNYFDELAHVQATNHLLQRGVLIDDVTMNQAAGYYPGLHAVAGSITAATGLSLFAAATILIAVMHVLTCVAIFALTNALVKSPRSALLAALLYAATPAYFYFDAQFSYGSIAIPMMAVALALIFSTQNRWDSSAKLAVAAVAMLIAFVVVTHHVSSYVFVGILLLCAAASRLTLPAGERRVVWPLMAGLCGLAIGSILLWIAFVAPLTVDYLRPYAESNIKSVGDALSGNGSARAPFSGATIPTYERVVGFASVPLLAAGFLLGVRNSVLRDRRRPALWVLAVLGSLYLVSLPFVLRSDLAARRIWSYAFIGLAPIMMFAVRPLLAHSKQVVRAATGVAVFVVVAGGVVNFSGEHLRFPGSYQASADPRAATPEVLQAAKWMKEKVGPGHRIIGDRTVSNVFGAYGDQTPVVNSGTGYRPDIVVMSPNVDADVRYELDRSRTDFVVIDRRILDTPALTGYYFFPKEKGVRSRTHRIQRAAIRKFREEPFTPIYDNGYVSIFRYRKGR